MPVVQMDTVVGSRKKGQRILTMLFLKTSVMLMFLIPDGKAQLLVYFHILTISTYCVYFCISVRDTSALLCLVSLVFAEFRCILPYFATVFYPYFPF